MEYKLRKKPKGVTIIEGFPGYGLVSTITIEFLLDHLKAVEIGDFTYDEFPATLAIHKGELVKPISIWHVPQHKLVLIHSTLNVQGREWMIADMILKIAKELEAKEIITLEGLVRNTAQTKTYTYNNKKLEALGAKNIKESIFTGITAALFLKGKKVVPLFASAHSSLPDGQAAAKIIEMLDTYLGLKVDPKPLLKKAKEFENKLKSIMQQTQQSQEEVDKKRLSYLG